MGSISSLRMDVQPHFQAAPELRPPGIARMGQISRLTAAADEAATRGNDQGRGCSGKMRREDPADEPSGSNGGESQICDIKRMGYKEEISGPKVKDENLGIRKKLEDQPSNAPKQDYIHVRARRGQATDSHSLAERARRERISERMKTLQDLVPGCNKIIGKASVLDEIINYIQSLQQQVEFLSMKLEAVSSRASSGLEDIMSKDLHKQTYEADSSMGYGSQAKKGYEQGSVQDWLHMQVGSPVERAT